MSNFEREGRNLLAEAEKKAAYKSFFGGNKLEEASDLYAKAANAFKLGKKWREAGDAFMSQGGVLLRMNERDEASSAFLNASKAFKKNSPQDAVSALQQAVELLTERGRFSVAANNQKMIAEIYENDLADFEKALHAYEIAAEWYSGEDSNAQANGCLLKVGQFAAQVEQYDKAIESFEKVASNSMNSALTRFSLKDYFLKAGLCYLCAGDTVRTRSALERYRNMDANFETSREHNFFAALLEAVEAQDSQRFTDVVADWDRLTKLDSWKTTLLLRLKKTLGEELDFT
ncbi:soluble NSF attachment protein [Phlyctochytrium arcticum]|nr:soluble NSF attachment protein [Phlyctochytrium arcticum]